MKGTYGVEGGALDFAGKAKLDATVSQMVGGMWGALLKPADRYFKKDGAGTEVPIRISGTREDPQVRHRIRADAEELADLSQGKAVASDVLELNSRSKSE